MKKILIVCLLLLSTVAMPIKPVFKKLFIGSSIVGIGSVVFAAYYANNQANEAITQAGIKIGSADHYMAKYLIIKYGLQGIDRGIGQMIQYENPKLITSLTVSKIGKALAIFWRIEQLELATRISAKGIGTAMKKGADKLEEISEKTINFFSRYF